MHLRQALKGRGSPVVNAAPYTCLRTLLRVRAVRFEVIAAPTSLLPRAAGRTFNISSPTHASPRSFIPPHSASSHHLRLPSFQFLHSHNMSDGSANSLYLIFTFVVLFIDLFTPILFFTPRWVWMWFVFLYCLCFLSLLRLSASAGTFHTTTSIFLPM